MLSFDFGLVLRSFEQSFNPSGSLGCGGSLFQFWIWTSPSLFQAVLRSLRQAKLRWKSISIVNLDLSFAPSGSPSQIQRNPRKSSTLDPAEQPEKSSSLRWTLQKTLDNPAFWDGPCRETLETQNLGRSRKTLENPAFSDGPCLGPPRVHFHLPKATSCYVFQGFDFGLYRYIYMYVYTYIDQSAAYILGLCQKKNSVFLPFVGKEEDLRGSKITKIAKIALFWVHVYYGIGLKMRFLAIMLATDQSNAPYVYMCIYIYVFKSLSLRLSTTKGL